VIKCLVLLEVVVIRIQLAWLSTILADVVLLELIVGNRVALPRLRRRVQLLMQRRRRVKPRWQRLQPLRMGVLQGLFHVMMGLEDVVLPDHKYPPSHERL
jgi:hypothetical protein